MSVDADRWLTPGTEYAIPEKLPLPRDWYKHWDAIEAGAKGSVTGLTDADIDDGEFCHFCRFCQVWTVHFLA